MFLHAFLVFSLIVRLKRIKKHVGEHCMMNLNKRHCYFVVVAEKPNIHMKPIMLPSPRDNCNPYCSSELFLLLIDCEMIIATTEIMKKETEHDR